MNRFVCLLVFTLVAQVNCQTTAASEKLAETSATGNVGTTSGNTDAPSTGASVAGPGKSSCNASLSTSADSAEDFRRLLDDGAVFVYMKLVFVDAEFEDPLAAYLEDIGNVINPLRWVWAKGGRGNLLLASPFDFNQLSLTTLGPGVFSVTVKIHGCIGNDVADEEKIDALAQILLDFVSGGGGQNNTDESGGADSDEVLVCLEEQLGKDDFPLPGVIYFPGSSYTTMQASSAFNCWPLGSGSGTKRVAPTQYWFGWILAGGVVLALFSPLALSFFVQKNPPAPDDKGVVRLGLVSDLPLGLKYVTCFWKNDNICVAITRWTLFILIFLLVQYIPVLVSFVTDMEDFAKRSAALYRTGPLNVIVSVVSHLLVNLVFFIAAIVLMERFFRVAGQSFLEPLLRERRRSPTVTSISEEKSGGPDEGSTAVEVEGRTATNGENDQDRRSDDSVEGHAPEEDESNIAYRHIVLVEVPREWKELWAPSTSLVSSQAFFYYMAWRAKMGLDVRAWKFVLFGWLWKTISQLVGAPPDNPRTALCTVIFILLYPFYLPLGLIFFAFNSLPLLYCMTRCLQTAISNDVKCSELMFALLIALASIAWFFKFVATFVYISELLGYSFMGFVVNADEVGPTVLVVVIIAGYVVRAITGFYDGYCVLFSKVMSLAEDADEETETRPSRESAPAASAHRDSQRGRRAAQRTGSGSGGGQDIEMTPLDGSNRDRGQGACGEDHDIQRASSAGNDRQGSAGASPRIPLVTCKDAPRLKLELFWLIVERYRPIRVQVASTFFELLVIVIGVGFGLSILAIADSLSNLSTAVELFASVIIAGVVPTVLLALKSPASQDCYNQAKERQMKADIFHYARSRYDRPTLRDTAQ